MNENKQKPEATDFPKTVNIDYFSANLLLVFCFGKIFSFWPLLRDYLSLLLIKIESRSVSPHKLKRSKHVMVKKSL